MILGSGSRVGLRLCNAFRLFFSSLMSLTRPQRRIMRPRVPSSTSGRSSNGWGRVFFTLSSLEKIKAEDVGSAAFGESREGELGRRGDAGEEKMRGGLLLQIRGARGELGDLVDGVGEGAGGQEGGVAGFRVVAWLFLRLRGGVDQAFAFSFTRPSLESEALLLSLAGSNFIVGLLLVGLGLFLPADFVFFLMQGRV